VHGGGSALQAAESWLQRPSFIMCLAETDRGAAHAARAHLLSIDRSPDAVARYSLRRHSLTIAGVYMLRQFICHSVEVAVDIDWKL